MSSYEKCGKASYLEAAKQIINGYLVLMPGVNQTRDKQKIEINPSYFAPYAFREFLKYDKVHNWNDVVDSSDYYLQEVCKKLKQVSPLIGF